MEDWEKHAWDEMRKEEDEQNEKDQKVLNEVRDMVTPEFYTLIEYEIKESEGGINFKIVDEPNGDYEDNDGIKVWVDQYENGGYSGDSYAGYVYVELPNKKYLKWHYSM